MALAMPPIRVSLHFDLSSIAFARNATRLYGLVGGLEGIPEYGGGAVVVVDAEDA